jgi:predicted  nucleic acid-binding Zn-ribbon protein
VPCYRCGTRQVDPEPGKPSPWHRGVVCEHQVLICPDCYPTALTELTRCPRCGGVRLVKRLDQVECQDCHLTRDASPEPAVPAPRSTDSDLAAEVASALARILGT